MINEREFREGGFDLGLGARYTGGGKDYELALKTFAQSYVKNEFEIVSNFEMYQLVHYTTLVHSLKSNFRTIGIEDGAELALKCEELGKKYSAVEPNEREKAEFEKANALLLQKYKEVVDFINEHLTDDNADEPEEKVADDKKVYELLDKFIAACDDFDDDKAKDILKELNGYSVDIIIKNHIDMAKDYIEGFDYEEASAEAKEAQNNIIL